MRQLVEGQELLADVHGTYVHEADPQGCEAIGVDGCAVEPCEECSEGRRLMALGVRSGQHRWERVDGFPVLP